MRILVTGGAGYIGSHAVALSGTRPRVWVYDNLCYRPPRGGACRPADRRRLERDASLDHCWSSAASRPWCISPPSPLSASRCRTRPSIISNNLVNTLNLHGVPAPPGVDRFVFSSTAATYGTPERLPITEDDADSADQSLWPTKLAIEQALADYAARLRLGLSRPCATSMLPAPIPTDDRRGPRCPRRT